MKKVLASILFLSLLLLPVSVLAVPLDEFYGIIEAHYIDSVSSRELRAVPPNEVGAFLKDPFFAFYTREELNLFIEQYRGDSAGVGIQIIEESKEIIVLHVYPGSPAARAGILPGDVLVRLNGISTAVLTLSDVTELLKGEAGSSIAVEVRRSSVYFRKTLVREYIESTTIRSEVKGDVGYIILYSFSEKSPELFRKHLAGLKAAGVRGYILDLRDNPGGTLGAVLDIAEEFLPAGPIINMTDRYGNETVYGNDTAGSALPNLVVLVNGNSASAAEILAGAVQDYSAGVLMGETTYGKASAQTVFVLSDGSGLKMTTARYLTAKGQAIDKVGLKPDLPVSGYRSQLEAALRLIRSNSATLVFRIGEQTAWSTGGTITADARPFIEGGRSYVPVRLLAETMGVSVEWNAAARTVVLQKDGTTLSIPMNGTALLNDRPHTMETPLLRDGRTYLPARAVASSFGGQVWWDSAAKEVIVAW